MSSSVGPEASARRVVIDCDGSSGLNFAHNPARQAAVHVTLPDKNHDHWAGLQPAGFPGAYVLGDDANIRAIAIVRRAGKFCSRMGLELPW
ncbi:MAG: hypothetical protein EPN33_00630 [Acidobacteria bacterium]|nr:MAG: hypothetical protein EPN33_00630 [Acidobacteriota bacterium]